MSPDKEDFSDILAHNFKKTVQIISDKEEKLEKNKTFKVKLIEGFRRFTSKITNALYPKIEIEVYENKAEQHIHI